MLDTCEEPVEVEANSANDAPERDKSERPAAGDATPTPTLVPEPEPQETSSVYASCEEAEEAGETRVQGSAGEGRRVSDGNCPQRPATGDGDGIVCER